MADNAPTPPSEAAKPTLWIAATAILAVALVAVVAGSGITGNFLAGSDGKAAADSAITFINDNLLTGNMTARLINVTEKSGLWFMTFEVANQTYTSYLTKDGQMLLPQAIPLAPSAKPATEEPEATTFDAPDAASPTAQLFVMSFCPSGIAAEKAMLPVVILFQDNVTVEPHFIIQVMNRTEAEAMLASMNSRGTNYSLTDKFYVLGDAYMMSLHGPNEAAEDVRQAVIYKEFGPAAFWNYVSYVDSNCSLADIEACWLSAADATGLNSTQVDAKVQTEGAILMTGDQLLTESYGVRGSPTLIINGAEYTGARTSEGYKAGICSGFETPPAACGQTLNNTAAVPSGGCGS